MTTKSLLIAGALTLATLGIASARSFDVTLSGPSMAGSTELKAGEYRLTVEGSQATFLNADTGKSYTVPVKVENAPAKFAHTMIETTNANGMASIHVIDLAGSTTRLEFGQ